MPYDTSARAFLGDAASNPQGAALEVLVNWLHERLNATGAGAGHEPALELDGEPVPISVTPVAIVADAITKGEASHPVVFVGRGRRRGDSWGRTIEGTRYEGHRYELTFPLDMATNLAEIDDTILCDAVCAAIDDHKVELWDLGLTDIWIEGDEEAQNAGIGRNPYLLTCAVYTLNNYQPPSAPPSAPATS